MIFNRINPLQRLVGRLFLFFWLTLTLAAVIALFVGRAAQPEPEFGSPTEEEIAQLNVLAVRLTERPLRPVPLQDRIDVLSRETQISIWLFDVEKNRVITPPGPARRSAKVEEIRRLSGQLTPISYTTARHRLIGPLTLTHRQRTLKLFVSKPTLGQRIRPFFWLIPLVLFISMGVSYIFARSLARPIELLRAGTKTLARGNWSARVDVGTRRDEIAELASDFNQMAEQLARLWSSQQRLLADISHELRSPLTRLQMALGLIQQQKMDHPAVSRIEKEVQRMELLISQLLMLTKTETHSASKQTLILSSILSPVFSDAEFEAAAQGKRCNFSAVPEIWVTVNLELIQRAVENVLRNAIKYCHSTISVLVECTESSWSVSISDDGPGLVPAECEQIFAPFYRVSTSRERSSGGTGLGLAIAKTAVELHHGTIQATTHQPNGLKVTIAVPLEG
ncbi:ATP-binding protein [Alteromonas ponticola]|uniref:histidine kinase n=1 Tax=Alteromonas ponticola TaxID=2720613 RepID=A0ABX1R0T5_9ALTE|nr:ATP-binding protein [Alteromonas ponticola]NMH60078.1 HAMP domain-containing protein [Alteromonas ponticola]